MARPHSQQIWQTLQILSTLRIRSQFVASVDAALGNYNFIIALACKCIREYASSEFPVIGTLV